MSFDREQVEPLDEADIPRASDGLSDEHARGASAFAAETAPSVAVTGTRLTAGMQIFLLLLCVATLIAIELVIVRGHVLAGDIADGMLLLVLLQLGLRPTVRARSLLSKRTRQAMIGLALVPLIRVVALGLPLRDGSGPAGTLVIAAIVGTSALALATPVGVSRRTLIAVRQPRLQILTMLGGLLLGLLAYFLGAPALWPAGASWDRVAVALLAAALAATVEEVVFRGIVQLSLQRVASGLGALAASALFTATYLNLRTVSLVLTVALASLVFSYSVYRTGTVGGAIAGHLLFALGAGAIWPVLLGRLDGPYPSPTVELGLVTLGLVLAWATSLIIPGHARLPLAQARRLRRTSDRAHQQGHALGQPAQRPAPGQVPAVRIVISNYNYGEFVTEAIESARRQDYPNVRVVVVDDGSTDDSRERLRPYEGVVDLVLKENGGQASAINAGLAGCPAEIVMLLDADDVLKPHAASRVAAAFAADGRIAKVQFRMEVIDAEGRATGVIKPQPHIPMPSGDLRSAELAFPFDLSWLGGGGTAFRADALKRILPIPEPVYPLRGADWYLVHLTTLLGLVVSLPDVCASYRVHGRNGYERRDLRLDLAHVRDTISYARATTQALASLADELGLDRPDPILSVSDLGNRLVSLKLEPDLHPVAPDRAWQLVASAVEATRRRFDVAWPMKAMFIAWFAATALAPQPLVHRLAESFMFPERRRPLNGWLRRMHQSPAKPTSPSAS